MLIIGVIPARFASVRFRGKPLAPLAGRPMVVHVLRAARAARRLSRVVVATDDPRIAEAVEKDGGEALLTSAQAASGTDRVVDVLLADEARPIATLAFPISAGAAADPNVVKVAVARDKRALYFSRSPIPHFRNGEPAYLKHLGIYAYRAKALSEIAGLPPSPLERAESLEQLRWLEAGYTIHVGEAAGDSIGVDTPEDLAAAEAQLIKQEVSP